MLDLRRERSTKLPAPLRELFDVGDARLVVVHRYWTGYSPDAPHVADYQLRRDARGAFVGEGRLSRERGSMHHREVAVDIDPAAAARFLDALGAAIVTEGAYRPKVTHTDDYPNLEITLVTEGDVLGVAVLYSESQGEFHAPWGVCVGGELLTIAGDEVGRTLEALDEKLRAATGDDTDGSVL